LEWTLPEQGDIDRHYRVTAEELGLSQMQNVFFVQNDAQNMAPEYGDFDLILASNLIDRVSNPALFLKHIHERARLGGHMVLCDPYLWDLEYTPKMNWIGGVVDEVSHKPVYSEDAVKALLLFEHWELVDEMDIDLVIKESKRRYEHQNTHCMVFRRI